MQIQIGKIGKSYIHSFIGLKPSAWKGILASLFESTLLGVFYFFSIYFVDDLHLAVNQVGLIISSYGVGAFFSGYLSGRLSDSYSPGLITISSLFMQATMFLLLIKIHSIFFLIPIVFLLGFATYGFITSNHVSVLKFCNSEQEKIKALNLLSTASNLGISIAAIFISKFEYIGFHNIFLLCAALLICLAIFLLTKDSHLQQMESLNVNAPTNRLKQQPIYFILIAVFFVGMIVSQQSSTYSLYVKNSFPTLGMKAVSILFTVNTLMVVFFGTIVGEIFYNHDKLKMVGLGAFFIGLGMLVLSFSSTIYQAILACMLYTFGEILFFCMVQFLCYEKGGNRKGTNMGLFRTSYAASRIAGPTLGTFIYNSYNPNYVWYISGLIGIIFLVLCLVKQHPLISD